MKKQNVILPDCIEEFAEYMTVAKNRSKKTVSEYKHDLLTFFRYTIATQKSIPYDSDEFLTVDISNIDIEYLKKINSRDIERYLVYTATQRGNCAATRSRKLSTLKSFFKYYTVNRRYLKDNPAKDIEMPKTEHRLPKFLTLEESLTLLDTVKNDKGSKTTKRDYAILTLFLNCGMRLSELTGISLTDIDPEIRSLRVIGKGNKERIIYLNEACRRAISDYLAVRALDGEIKDKNALFLSRIHKRISNQTVQWLVYKYLDMAGLHNRHFSTHKLRHTAATLMYQTGQVDVRVLKDILGHEQLNTTQIYTHVSDSGMEEAMTKNPLAGLNGSNNEKK